MKLYPAVAVLATMAFIAVLSGPTIAGLPADIDLGSLDGASGFVLHGIDPLDFAGVSVSGAGDLNGDGLDDVFVGSPDARGPNGEASAGSSYVIFGRREPFPAALDLGSIDATIGFTIRGRGFDTSAGSVAVAGDVNDDGIDDLIIGAHGANGNRGAVFVVFGSTTPFPADLDLTTLDGTNGFVLNGIDEDDFTGSAVDGAGDVNADGIPDILIGASFGDPQGIEDAGEAYVVFGRSDGFPAALDLSALTIEDGFVVHGYVPNGRLGNSVSGVGDVNGDGVDDFMLGAHGIDATRGATYVLFGRANGFPSSGSVASLDGTNGFAAIGASAREESGASVAGAGDLNADGLADMIIGAAHAAPGGKADAGRSYVLLGRPQFSATFDLGTLDGTNGFALEGDRRGAFVGISVASAWDIDADGIGDLLVGASAVTVYGRGHAHVVFGSVAPFPAVIDVGGLDGTDGYTLSSPVAYDALGTAVSAAGDLNGDGIGDVILGAPFAGAYVGDAYVVFGRRPCFDGSVNLAAGEPSDVLLVNGLPGYRGTLGVNGGAPIAASLLLPPAGGNGRFVVHANFGEPSSDTLRVLPASIGVTCFPMILPGASPDAVWNNVGRRSRVGASHYFDGTPKPDPAPAPVTFLDLAEGDAVNLPPGTSVTLQGAMVDPASESDTGVSITNAVILRVE